MKMKRFNMLACCCMCVLLLCSCGHEEFAIEGKWKNVGDYTLGQAQEGAIIAFDGTKCNLYSPSDTYAFYKNGDRYTLECSSLNFGETLTFDVEVIDADHINLHRGNHVLELQRPGADSSGETEKELTQEEKAARKRVLQFVMYEDLVKESSENLSELEGKSVMYDEDDVLLDGIDVKEAEIATQEDSTTGEEQKVVNITFTEKGKKEFAKITAEAVGKQIAIISNGKLISAPYVNSEITEGRCVIAFLSANAGEMQDMVDKLN